MAIGRALIDAGLGPVERHRRTQIDRRPDARVGVSGSGNGGEMHTTSGAAEISWSEEASIRVDGWG